MTERRWDLVGQGPGNTPLISGPELAEGEEVYVQELDAFGLTPEEREALERDVEAARTQAAEVANYLDELAAGSGEDAGVLRGAANAVRESIGLPVGGD